MKHIVKTDKGISTVYDPKGNIIKEYYTSDGVRNIVDTKYWFWDLRGRLKQDIARPVKYHDQERIYVKEDIEEIIPNKEYISYIVVKYGNKTLARTEHHVKTEDMGNYRHMIETFIDRLIAGNWKLYKIDNPELDPKHTHFKLDAHRYKEIHKDRKPVKKPPLKRKLCKKKVVKRK